MPSSGSTARSGRCPRSSVTAWRCGTWARCRPTASRTSSSVWRMRHGPDLGLLLLPLAPVRGTVWLAERIEEQAEQELYDEPAIRRGLLELEVLREHGDLPAEEIEAAEDELLERLMQARDIAQGRA